MVLNKFYQDSTYNKIYRIDWLKNIKRIYVPKRKTFLMLSHKVPTLL